VNGDGKPDLLVANCGSAPGQSCGFGGTVGVLLGNGDGTFQPAEKYDSGGLSANSVAIADVNGDGKLDLLVAAPYWWCNSSGGCSANGAVAVLPGNGNGTFQAPVTFLGGPHANVSAAVSIASADLNGDGKPDLVVSKTNGFAAVLLNNFTAKTTTALRSSLNPSFVNQSVTFTATVTSNPPVADGESVTFYDGATALTSVALAGGTASYSTSSLAAKTHYIHAKYGGNIWRKPSTGTVQQVVLKYPTTTALTSNPNPSAYGQAVTFMVAVTPSGPYAITGWVKFWDGSTGIGMAKLNGRVAILKKSTLGVGTHAITAGYLGDSLNAKSTSPVLNQVVQ